MTTTDDTLQAATHTPEPWYVSTLADNTPVVQSATLEEDNFICQVEGRDNDEAHANARRICAAVNACEGISTEALGQGIIAELLANLKTLLEQIDEDVPTDTTTRHFANAYDEALAALAKATGRAV